MAKSLGKCLILNADYSPISITSVEHAVTLFFCEKIDITVARSNKVLHSATQTWPFPSVVRVKDYVKLPFKKTPLTKRNVFLRDGYQCGYCLNKKSEMTIDHIIPTSRGGAAHSWENVITCCKSCNNRKDAYLLEEIGMKLLKKPTRPSHIMFLKSLAKEIDSEWEQYLFQ